MGTTKTKKPLQPVLVEWMDAHSSGGIGDDWNAPQFLAKYAKLWPVRSVGFVLRGTPKHVLVLVQSQINGGSVADGAVADSITIPRANVRRVRRLKVA